MYNYVNWNQITSTQKDVATEFIRLANLNKIDAKIILDRKNEIVQYATAESINRSKEYITKRIKDYLMPLYVKISEEYPDIFPSMNLNKDCSYKNVETIVNMEIDNTLHSVSLKRENFLDFADIRLSIIEKFQKKYGIEMEKTGPTKIYLSGTYNFENKKLSNFYNPSLESKNHLFSKVRAIVNIETDTDMYQIKLENLEFNSFADIRLYVVNGIEQKYNIKLSDFKKYDVYLTGYYEHHNI